MFRKEAMPSDYNGTTVTERMTSPQKNDQSIQKPHHLKKHTQKPLKVLDI